MHNDLIYDVGMSSGDDTAYYLHKGYRVVAVEALPHKIEAARQRFQDAVRSGRLVLVHAAIAPDDGPVPFYVCDTVSDFSTSDEAAARAAGWTPRKIEVPGRRFAGILREHGVPYYLKIDIEGCSRYCLEAIDPADPPPYVSFEIGGLEELAILSTKGYRRFKCVGQGPQTLPYVVTPFTLDQRQLRAARRRRALKRRLEVYPALSGLAQRSLRAVRGLRDRLRDVARPRPGPAPADGAWTFRGGDTGPFAEDSPGPWQSLEEVAFSWLSYRLGIGLFGPNPHGWFDIHARHGSVDAG